MFRQYLSPVLGRGNLTVVTGAQTQQVVFEKHGSRPRARGVTFSIGGPDGTQHSGGHWQQSWLWSVMVDDDQHGPDARFGVVGGLGG